MTRMHRLWRVAAVFLGGGGLFVLDSCDPEVRSTVLSGVQSAANGLANTFINALFLKLAEDDATQASIRVIEDVVRMLT